MDPGGLEGDDGIDPDHDPGPEPREPPMSGPADSPRPWTHPSEAGMALRDHTDRRRSRALVLGLVALGAGLLIGTALMTTAFSRSDDSGDASATSTPTPLENCLALVEVQSGGSSPHLNGLLVDDGHHVVVSEADLEAAGFTAGDGLTVRIHGSRSGATIVARDQYADLALLRLQSPAGAEPQMSPDPEQGDPLRAVRFDSEGQRRSTMVRVAGVDATWTRPDSTVTTDVMTLSGDTVDNGVLVDPQGAVAGLVIGASNGRSVAYSSEVLRKLVGRLSTGEVTEHPWIGVRVGDLRTPSAVATTSIAVAQTLAPEGGAVIQEVIPGSPAASAGLVAEDVITGVDGEPVATMADLVDAIGALSPDDVVVVDLVRSGAPLQLRVRIGTAPG